MINLEDQKLNQLIELAVVDPNRKDLYHQAMPKMTAEEKLNLLVGLWQMWLSQLNRRTVDVMEEMIAEMGNPENDISYEKEDFAKAQDNVRKEMIAERVGLEEEDALDSLREELMEIQNIVKEHEKELKDIKTKIDN